MSLRDLAQEFLLENDMFGCLSQLVRSCPVEEF